MEFFSSINHEFTTFLSRTEAENKVIRIYKMRNFTFPLKLKGLGRFLSLPSKSNLLRMFITITKKLKERMSPIFTTEEF